MAAARKHSTNEDIANRLVGDVLSSYEAIRAGPPACSPEESLRLAVDKVVLTGVNLTRAARLMRGVVEQQKFPSPNLIVGIGVVGVALAARLTSGDIALAEHRTEGGPLRPVWPRGSSNTVLFVEGVLSASMMSDGVEALVAIPERVYGLAVVGSFPTPEGVYPLFDSYIGGEVLAQSTWLRLVIDPSQGE